MLNTSDDSTTRAMIDSSAFKIRPIHIWGIAGCVVIAWVMQSLSAILLPFVAGCLGAYALNTFVTYLEKWHISRGLGTALIMMIVITLIGMFLMILIPYMHGELLDIYKNLPRLSNILLDKIGPFLEHISQKYHVTIPTLDQLKSNVSSHVGDIAQVIVSFMLNLLSRSMVLANIISLLVLTPIIMFYMLKDWPIFTHNVMKIVPRKHIRPVRQYMQRVHATLSGYVRGQIMVCMILMILYSISLTIVGLPDAFFIGFVTGLLAFIPYLGAFIGFMLAMLVAFLHMEGWWSITSVIIAFGIVSTLEGNYLTPRFVGQKVGLHPVWIIFALMAAGSLFGFMGVIIALPVAAVLGTTLRIAMEAYYKSSLYTLTETP